MKCACPPFVNISSRTAASRPTASQHSNTKNTAIGYEKPYKSQTRPKTPDIETKVITNIYGLTLGCLTTSDQSSMQSDIKQKHYIYSASSKRITNTCKQSGYRNVQPGGEQPRQHTILFLFI
jgi:hypothetical protein